MIDFLFFILTCYFSALILHLSLLTVEEKGFELPIFELLKNTWLTGFGYMWITMLISKGYIDYLLESNNLTNILFVTITCSSVLVAFIKISLHSDINKNTKTGE